MSQGEDLAKSLHHQKQVRVGEEGGEGVGAAENLPLPDGQEDHATQGNEPSGVNATGNCLLVSNLYCPNPARPYYGILIWFGENIPLLQFSQQFGIEYLWKH